MLIFFKVRSTSTKGLSLFWEWVNKKSEDITSFIDESPYTYFAIYTWFTDLGATVHVANSMQGLQDIIDLREVERKSNSRI